MMTCSTSFSRRTFVTAGIAAFAGAAFSTPALALTTAQAERLIQSVVADINKVINSGRSENAMIREFAGIFERYADVERIARFTLGADARAASSGQIRAYNKAFAGYISRKYGRRFREFIGGEITVKSAKSVKSFVEVRAEALLSGERPFDVTFRVNDNGLFADMLIEGISLARTEKTEIGALLDRRNGNLDQLTRDLSSL